jgi:ABC-type uncharacterized transport system substrate-binding protein
MTRRRALALLAVSPLAAPLHAQAQPALPTVGFIRSTPAEPFAHLVTAFRAGLKEAGLVEGQSVAIEYRYADNQPGRLPGLVADLVQRQVAVIVCNQGAAIAAKAGTATVPIVFVAGGDPVQAGLVPSLQRPGGNLTGVTFFGGAQLAAKRIELLHDLVPKVGLIGVLQDPSYAGSIADVREITAAARALGLRTVVAHAARQEEFDPAFGRIVQAGAGALVVSGAALFTSRLQRLVALATRHAMPVMYDQRDYVVAGGLISYSASFTGAYHQAGMYAARILKGARPGELPVLQPTTFELVINLKTAKALGLAVSPSVLARAEEVIR